MRFWMEGKRAGGNIKSKKLISMGGIEIWRKVGIFFGRNGWKSK